MYFENFIQNDKMIKYLFDQDIVITVKFFNNSSTLEKYYSSYQRYDNEDWMELYIENYILRNKRNKWHKEIYVHANFKTSEAHRKMR